MKISSTSGLWLADATAQLQRAGIDTAHLDSLVLLCDETGLEKAQILAHPEYTLRGSVIKILNTKLAQRIKHIPLAYIRGHVEFYGRDFVVNEHVLVPRPDSEAMIELLQILANEANPAIDVLVDVGTGSGALAITAKLEIPTATVLATDLDKNCLQIAQKNADRLGAVITLMHGNLLKPLCGANLLASDTVLLANLPYVPENYPINAAASHEPKHALFSSTDGLDYYRLLFSETRLLATRPRRIITEALKEQHDSLSEIAASADYSLQHTSGLAQLFLAY